MASELEMSYNFVIVKDINLLFSANFENSYDLQFYRSKDIGETINFSMIAQVDFEFDIAKGLVLDFSDNLEFAIEFIKTIEYQFTSQSILTANLTYGRSNEVLDTIELPITLNIGLSYTAYHPKFANPTIEVVSYASGTDAGGDFLFSNLSS